MTTRFTLFATLSSLFALGACSSGGTGTGGKTSSGTTKASSSSTSAGGAGGALPAFTVDDISKKSAGLEAESTVAVGKNGIVASAWNVQGGKPAIGYAFSTDGGKTWLPPAVASPPDAFGYGDPTLAAADDGTLYLSFVAFNQGFTAGRVHVAKAAPGATSFDPPVVASDAAQNGPYDKPVMAITKSQTLLVSYTDLAQNQVVVARSTDGATFTRTPAVKNDPAATLSMPCPSLGGGRVWVVYQRATSIQLRWSDDDGATFPTQNASRVSPTSDTDVSAEDPVCVGKGNDVWVLYGRSHDMLDPSSFNYKDYALRLAHSSDGGATFSSVNDVQDASAAKFFMEPAMALEANGTLDLAYYAGNMDDDPAGSFRLARSTDAGQSFGASAVISSPVVFTLSRMGTTWLGDYSWIVPVGGRLYTTFGHNVPAPAHISFASLPLP